ncbi:MAG TPA: alpha/beta hydrolase [Acidimicrobiales bacterium]|nr:alpha/beta hydrolase [Acidimicrobiales bacterium]
MTEQSAAPPLPPGRYVDLPGRGTTFIREVPGPPGAPVLVLLHGWTATADINWFPSFAALGRRFRVIALDHRGHGRGLSSAAPFRLRDCADDVAALADELGIASVIPVGYSMGGPVAQLVWHRHPERVQGLVLCATAKRFATSRDERLMFYGMGALARASRLSPAMLRDRLSGVYLARRARRYDDWAMEQLSRHDWTKILEAGQAIGRFSSREWVGDIDVPVAVVITMGDRVVPLQRQIRLFESIPAAKAFRVDGDHDACVINAERFVPTLVSACTYVAEQARVAAAG